MDNNSSEEIGTLIELFMLLMIATFSIFATKFAVEKMTSFATSYLDRDKVIVNNNFKDEVNPYNNLCAYEVYMMNWIVSVNVDEQILTSADSGGSDYVLLTTREDGHPRSNFSVYKARTVTGYAGTTPNVKDIIKRAPGGVAGNALENKYRGNTLRYTLELSNRNHINSAVTVTNKDGQILETKERFIWTLTPRVVP